MSFVPLLVAPPPMAALAVRGPEPGADRIEIVLANGRRIIVGADVDPVAPARVVSVLERA